MINLIIHNSLFWIACITFFYICVVPIGVTQQSEQVVDDKSLYEDVLCHPSNPLGIEHHATKGLFIVRLV